MKKLPLLILLFLGICLWGQYGSINDEMVQKASKNFELLDKDPQKAFLHAQNIEQEAQKLNAKEAELIALNTKCGYYRVESNFKKILESAEVLFQKATAYKNPFFQVVAKRTLFEAYLFTGLSERAFQELESGNKLLKNLDTSNPKNITEIVNFYTAYSNYYLFIEDFPNQLKYTRLARKELLKLPNNSAKGIFLYMHNSNMAAAFYKNQHLDSAKYYAQLSMDKDSIYNINQVKYNNLTVMGAVSMSEGKFAKAIQYLTESEKVDGYKNHKDVEEVYDNLMKAYHALGHDDLVQLYSNKKDSLKLVVSENQNETLQKIINEKIEKNSSTWSPYWVYFGLGFLLIGTISIIKRKRYFNQDERKSDEYIKQSQQNQKGESYSRLIQLLKENNPAFRAYFDEVFPDFSAKLKEMNPKLSESEIDFAALLKLKIPTKDIAKYKFLAPQTVRNKKYLLKNKLSIPKDCDIYQWFDEL